MTRDYAIRLKDRTRDVTLIAPAESCVSILAAARDHTASVQELLEDASYYDETVDPTLLETRAHGESDPEAAAELDSQAKAFEVDLEANRIRFPGNVIDFARRGVLAHRDGDGRLHGDDYRTYELGRRFTLRDGDRNMVVDAQASLRNEKSLWSNALPPRLEASTAYKLDGVDLDHENLRDIYTWTQTAMPRAPEVEGKSVYEIHMHAATRHGPHYGAPGGPADRAGDQSAGHPGREPGGHPGRRD